MHREGIERVRRAHRVTIQARSDEVGEQCYYKKREIGIVVASMRSCRVAVRALEAVGAHIYSATVHTRNMRRRLSREKIAHVRREHGAGAGVGFFSRMRVGHARRDSQAVQKRCGR